MGLLAALSHATHVMGKSPSVRAAKEDHTYNCHPSCLHGKFMSPGGGQVSLTD